MSKKNYKKALYLININLLNTENIYFLIKY